MINLKTLAAAGTIALGMASAAQATAIPSPGISFTQNVNSQFDIIFNFSPDVNQQTSPTGIGFDFNLTIESVTGDNPALGFFIDGPDGRLTNDITCSGFSGVENCNLIFGDITDSQLLFSDLAAGEYNFGVFGVTVQNAGSITFGIDKFVAPVPLPAGGLLLLTGLGALAFKRRRKAA